MNTEIVTDNQDCLKRKATLNHDKQEIRSLDFVFFFFFFFFTNFKLLWCLAEMPKHNIKIHLSVRFEDNRTNRVVTTDNNTNNLKYNLVSCDWMHPAEEGSM